MSARDRDHHGIAYERGQVRDPRADQLRDTACGGAFEHGAERRGRVILPDDQEAVEACTAGVEQVARAVGRERDVGDERQSFGAHLQATHHVEMTLPVREEIDDRECDFLVLTRRFEFGPVTAVHDPVLALDGGVHPLRSADIREHGGDCGHGGEGRRWRAKRAGASPAGLDSGR